MGKPNVVKEINATSLNPSRARHSIPELLLTAAEAVEDTSGDDTVQDALRTIRTHLDMEVAFVSEFSETERHFRYVDAASSDPVIKVGDGGPLEGSYCQRVVDGRLPELIPDALSVPAALELPVTTALPVRAHLSVPIRLSNGQLYGTFCTFSSTKPDPSLRERDLSMMRVFADFTAKQIERRLEMERLRKEMGERIQLVLDTEAFTIVYQPIFDIFEQRIIGFESLTRFSATPTRSPNIWFSEAEEAGLSEQLEMAVIEKALAALDQLPEDIYISLNISPDNILSGAITRTLSGVPLHRIMLEMTEHVVIPDYSQFRSILQPLRHILQLEPDLIKLDMSLIRDIDTDHTRRALALALINFAGETGSCVIAEGVETMSELETLRSLRAGKAQGYLLGRPTEIGSAAALVISTDSNTTS
jgi:EAL domain-containing protein (putative c-di-GMP-specific phosphodiesterase class I)